jgi:hypothetical protein
MWSVPRLYNIFDFEVFVCGGGTYVRGGGTYVFVCLFVWRRFSVFLLVRSEEP